ncbi:MAG: acyl-CoA dehydrogenase family protein, partial [Actinomycetota bacterium]
MSSDIGAKDLVDAARAIELADSVIGKAVRTLAATGGPDEQQVLAYDLAHASAAVETARSMLDYGAKGEVESTLTCAFVADMVQDLVSRLIGREKLWGVDPSALVESHDFVSKFRDPRLLASLADKPGPRHLDDDYEMVQDTFRSFATTVIAPRAEHVHRENLDVPEEIISGLAEIGAFGLSIPSEYGGFS